MNEKYKYFSKNKITKKSKRRFAIGDIHGCAETLKALIENKIQITKDCQIFLLGDYIDKGPASKKVVDYIIELINKGYKIYPLLGNHEEEKIKAEKSEPEILSWLMRNEKDMLENGKLKSEYLEFFEHLPYYYETDDFLFVHAACNFDKDKPFEDKISMMQMRRFENNIKFTKGKTIIHGHQPVNIEDIKADILERKNIINLDCGVNYIKPHKIYDYKKMSRLCALDLDTYELLIQENIER